MGRVAAHDRAASAGQRGVQQLAKFDHRRQPHDRQLHHLQLRGGWVFDSGLEIEAGVENIADELYAYEEGFYEPGRRYNFGLAYRF